MRELDSGVGRILQRLVELSIDNRTFVFFSSDNGGARVSKTRGNANNNNDNNDKDMTEGKSTFRPTESNELTFENCLYL